MNGEARCLLTLPQFNRHVWGAAWAPAASLLFCEGYGETNSRTQCWVIAASPSAKRVVWQMETATSSQYSYEPRMDAAGKLVLLGIEDSSKVRIPRLFDVTTLDQIAACNSFPPAFHSGANLACNPSLSEHQLRTLRESKLVLTIPHPETRATFYPVFSSDGRLLAWGNDNGTVTVCDLEEMNRRLGKLKLGWQAPKGANPAR